MTPRNGHDRGLWPLEDDERDGEPIDDERDLARGEGGTIELPLSPEEIAEDD
ncbi:hypothetical protein [Bradyrhizobium aeschynomenes]|uniref:hypothetical protein n=1 Tax=Bradyrhizobium aeschynomenes TaxID=2734909 RepID=UPI001554D423|nr:hypothetical protein [Bradyrhizobium aeschynomenes]NPV23934.1 hypothetical protein [Bradyrhizobium aeschynomenes]